MGRIFWAVLVFAAVATVAFSPSGEPARPEPGAQAVVRAVFEGEQ